MATETLSVPEEHLLEVINVIRAGLKATKVTPEVRARLGEWCKAEEEYINRQWPRGPRRAKALN